MRYPIPTLILACSVGFAFAGNRADVKPGSGEEGLFPGKETPEPGHEKAPLHQKTKKAPAPQEKPAAAPQRDEPADAPAQAEEEDTDCDNCVLVMATPSPLHGRPALADAKTAATTASGPAPVRWPTALARTLWGLFIAGRPRRLPKTHIRGVTVR